MSYEGEGLFNVHKATHLLCLGKRRNVFNLHVGFGEFGCELIRNGWEDVVSLKDVVDSFDDGG